MFPEKNPLYCISFTSSKRKTTPTSTRETIWIQYGDVMNYQQAQEQFESDLAT